MRGDFINKVGWGTALYPFELATGDEYWMAQFMSERHKKGWPIDGIGITGNGSIELFGAVFANLWSYSNIDDGLDETLDLAQIDPLLYGFQNDIQLLIVWAQQALPQLGMLIPGLKGLDEAMYEIMKSPAMRLYLTKRALHAFYKERLIEEQVLASLGIHSDEESIIEDFIADYSQEAKAIGEVASSVKTSSANPPKPRAMAMGAVALQQRPGVVWAGGHACCYRIGDIRMGTICVDCLDGRTDRHYAHGVINGWFIIILAGRTYAASSP